MARVYDEATILLLVFHHPKKFFFAKFALRECLVRNTKEVNTFVLGHQHGQIDVI